LGLPASNAFQERIFSACTWHDDPLNQRLQTDRFEKKVISGGERGRAAKAAAIMHTHSRRKNIVNTFIL
jgi:hypothetical protein